MDQKWTKPRPPHGPRSPGAGVWRRVRGVRDRSGPGKRARRSPPWYPRRHLRAAQSTAPASRLRHLRTNATWEGRSAGVVKHAEQFADGEPAHLGFVEVELKLEGAGARGSHRSSRRGGNERICRRPSQCPRGPPSWVAVRTRPLSSVVIETATLVIVDRDVIPRSRPRSADSGCHC